MKNGESYVVLDVLPWSLIYFTVICSRLDRVASLLLLACFLRLRLPANCDPCRCGYTLRLWAYGVYKMAYKWTIRSRFFIFYFVSVFAVVYLTSHIRNLVCTVLLPFFSSSSHFSGFDRNDIATIIHMHSKATSIFGMFRLWREWEIERDREWEKERKRRKRARKQLSP